MSVPGKKPDVKRGSFREWSYEFPEVQCNCDCHQGQLYCVFCNDACRQVGERWLQLSRELGCPQCSGILPNAEALHAIVEHVWQDCARTIAHEIWSIVETEDRQLWEMALMDLAKRLWPTVEIDTPPWSER